MRMTIRRFAVASTFASDATMGGARSPMTTKNAVQVPSRKPIMLTSTASLPPEPNVWKAEGRTGMRAKDETWKKNCLSLTEQLVVPPPGQDGGLEQQVARHLDHHSAQQQHERGQHHTALKRKEGSKGFHFTVALSPEEDLLTCLKQNGMARMLTPMMLLARVNTKRSMVAELGWNSHRDSGSGSPPGTGSMLRTGSTDNKDTFRSGFSWQISSIFLFCFFLFFPRPLSPFFAFFHWKFTQLYFIFQRNLLYGLPLLRKFPFPCSEIFLHI